MATIFTLQQDQYCGNTPRYSQSILDLRVINRGTTSQMLENDRTSLASCSRQCTTRTKSYLRAALQHSSLQPKYPGFASNKSWHNESDA
ncbi:hypothetical protein J6590_041659 [Homalodisca vitripennis]|nr:hypothetical protein J6590_041659 [Homalodisca vitripennis]